MIGHRLRILARTTVPVSLNDNLKLRPTRPPFLFFVARIETPSAAFAVRHSHSKVDVYED